ncbi:mandelate racemase/muconate lactonizing enzyme family protein [Saccharopolyspora phatthalungensis]|uniref:L-alanine-DL-glutamate epimerase-like enolase superfamily enzyme n=1 Tax=Saccharopolyspora phatthalungensis TaxID=664693 RepID=A0A840Q134_9PSEU|nr:mandelate racemase/muconate lactonizing enzyme family protein [Saccharopolyspora phatthalungensis]MBB5154074.1 L-alanine-DL-glutamate epimerase-like enolase superfamily enzyme [Saccharopolyspora phatthalungensis]
MPFQNDEQWAYGSRRGLVSVLIEIDTDEGITGLGEAPAYPSADIVLAVLRSIERFAIGEDPFHTERIAKLIDIVSTWHHVSTTSPAMAAIDMACWDIIGKACGQPLVNIFGGPLREDVEYLHYVPQGTPEWMREQAARGAAAGFKTFYVKVGATEPATDVQRVAAIRDGIGSGPSLRVDANESWSPPTALRALRSLEPYDIEFAEQPVPRHNVPEMALLRARSGVPLLADEASRTRYDQLDVIRQGAADAISVDNVLDGSLLNMKRSAGICEAAGIPVVKQSLGELGVATYAAAHLIAATPGFRCANQSYGQLLSDDVVEGGPLPYRDGRLRVPDGPGIGVLLDRDRLARYAELYQVAGHEYGFAARADGAPEPPER